MHVLGGVRGEGIGRVCEKKAQHSGGSDISNIQAPQGPGASTQEGPPSGKGGGGRWQDSWGDKQMGGAGLCSPIGV